MSSPFSLRLPDDVIRCLDYIADDYNVTRTQVISWACEAYVEIAKANDSQILSRTQLEVILEFIRNRAVQEKPKLQMVAETPHEPGKIIDPAAAGGAGSVSAKKYQPAKKRKS